MPNRVLRDCTDSEKINMLDVHAERFFYRLIMIVDDYGRYYAHAGLLRSRMFPFQIDKIREADITRSMAACQEAGLIVFYEVAGKWYLEINDFKQRLDKAKEKYPSPITGNSITIDNDFPVEKKRNRKEKETESETETEVAALPWDSLDFKKWWSNWKKYKKEQHRESYKSTLTEQAALKKLSELSEGDEMLALKIIEESIAQGWKGLFPLKKKAQQNNYQNGQQVSKNESLRNSAEEAKRRIREDIARADAEGEEGN